MVLPIMPILTLSRVELVKVDVNGKRSVTYIHPPDPPGRIVH